MGTTLWGRKSSFNVQKAMWALEEAGIPYERVDAGGAFGGLRDPSYLAMNPNGYIPTLEDDGFVLWESHAIVRYVAEQYAGGSLYPADIRQRALAGQWMDWMQSNLHGSFMDLFWSLVRTPEGERNLKHIHAVHKRVMMHMLILEGQLARMPYLAGEDFSMADIPAGCVLYRFFEMPMERPSIPHVEAWYGRLKEREAYRKGVMIPFGELYGRLAF